MNQSDWIRQMAKDAKEKAEELGIDPPKLQLLIGQLQELRKVAKTICEDFPTAERVKILQEILQVPKVAEDITEMEVQYNAEAVCSCLYDVANIKLQGDDPNAS